MDSQSVDYHRTTIEITILSEGPVPGDMDIADIMEEGLNGGYVLTWDTTADEVLTGPQMAEELVEAGSDPSFFGLDEDESLEADPE